MPEGLQSGMQCADFEALLSEALDGALAGPKLESFQAHKQLCPLCGPLFADAEAGRTWLHTLPEIEPPRNLVHNILAATSGITHPEQSAAPAQPNFADKLRGWLQPIAAPVWGAVRSPRFAMSFGMAFFSISIALNVAGVKIGDLRYADLRPSALQKEYYATTTRITRYYENIRFVYEIESRVRELKRVAEPEEQPKRENNKERKNDTSGRPERKQNENYSRDGSQPLLAGFADDATLALLRAGRDI
jgi:hypothetical protein